jgi:Domain of unknown function (DUF4115)
VPGTRLEQLIFGIGVLAIAGLAVLTFSAWRNYHDEAPAAASVAVAAPAPPPATTSAASAEFKAPAQTHPSTSLVVLTAARGDSWVEVHVGSASGKPLYAGTLTQGHRVRYRKSSLWIRLGRSSNLDATVDGKAATLPLGTASVVVRNGRLRTVQQG